MPDIMTMTEAEFKEWFKAEWTKVTEELKVYNLSNVRLVVEEVREVSYKYKTPC